MRRLISCFNYILFTINYRYFEHSNGCYIQARSVRNCNMSRHPAILSCSIFLDSCGIRTVLHVQITNQNTLNVFIPVCETVHLKEIVYLLVHVLH